ncbi:hypothetical protein CEXT_689021 [Caerostris extrusa]|uniref:Uncharacterized protein n=1 Tax=Caerostris extrusa TaxID=172846 RepID=A0AAV4PJN8_CAEEX|nr:hypothetical protein CEXT_689021 [Caerostris extrusa]
MHFERKEEKKRLLIPIAIRRRVRAPPIKEPAVPERGSSTIDPGHILDGQTRTWNVSNRSLHWLPRLRRTNGKSCWKASHWHKHN